MVSIETLNQWAQSWAEFMGYRLLDSTIVLMIVGSLWFLLRRRVSAQLGYWLFLLVLLKLILPSPISVPTPVNDLVPGNVMVSSLEGLRFEPGQPALQGALTNTNQKPVNTSSVSPAADQQDESASKETVLTPTLSVLAILMLGWAGIVLLLMTRLVWCQWRTHRALNDADSLDANTAPLDLVQIQKTAGVKRPVRWLTCSWASAPVVWGVFRPAIVVPSDLFTAFSKNQIRWILLHELAHIRRGDNVVSIFQGIVQIVFFFHPAVWIANMLIDQQREFACDDVALAGCEAPRSDCGEGLLSIARNANGLPTFMTTPLGLLNHNTLIRRRMMRILDTNRTLRLGLSAGSLVLLLVAALVLLPSVRAEDTQMNENRMLAQADTETETSPAKSLHEAAAEGDLELVKSLVSKGADVNAEDEKGRTALHRAAMQGRKEVVGCLIDRGADINAKNDFDYSPLHYAILGDDEATVRLLIAKGADVNVTPKGGDLPIHDAVWMENIDMVELLLAHGAELNAKDQYGWTPLRHAAWQAHRELIDIFVAKGADIAPFHLSALLGDFARLKNFVEQGTDVDMKDEVGWTALHWAASTGQTEVSEFLLAKGATVNVKDENSETPLHNAARGGAKELVDLFLRKGADVNAKDHKGRTPLHWAAAQGRKAVAKLLIAHGADLDAKDDNGRTPLLRAVHRGHKEVADLLISRGADEGADIDAKVDKWGCTALHLAARRGDKDMAEFLLSRGANIEARNMLGATPLHEAASNNQPEMIEFLLEHGAHIDAWTRYDGTPLLEAVAKGHKDAAEVLLAHGANLRARKRGADLPVDYAMLKGKDEMVKLLIDKGATFSDVHIAAYFGQSEKVMDHLSAGGDIDAKDASGLTLLYAAICGKQSELVESLIEKGADINAQDDFGWTPLHVASRHGDDEIVRLLLAEGADVGLRDKEGLTALHWAAGPGNLTIVNMLLDKKSDPNAKSGFVITWGERDCHWTPLHNACAGGQKEVAEVLIEHGADINAKTESGQTPLSMAKKEYHFHGTPTRKELIELLRKHGAEE